MTKEIFIDTASIPEIEKWQQRLNITGVTTNQLILLKEGETFGNIQEAVMGICAVIDAPISVELTTKLETDHDIARMLDEARKYHDWHENVILKVPMTVDGRGLAVVKQLAKESIPTNATAMMTFEQLLLATNAGATYVSLFYGRSREYFQQRVGLSHNQAKQKALSIIGATADFIEKGNFHSRMIIGSIRDPFDVGDAFSAGAHIVTIPPKILEKMVFNERTKETLEQFNQAWEDFLALRDKI